MKLKVKQNRHQDACLAAEESEYAHDDNEHDEEMEEVL